MGFALYGDIIAPLLVLVISLPKHIFHFLLCHTTSALSNICLPMRSKMIMDADGPFKQMRGLHLNYVTSNSFQILYNSSIILSFHAEESAIITG
jgi:hypothetical protein